MEILREIDKQKEGFSLIQLMSIIAIIGILAAGAAIAGSVYDREVVTLGTTTGTKTWTNDYDYAAVQLKRIWIEGNLDATATVTVTRVTSDSTYTQAVGTVACTAGSGSSASFTASYLKPGDKLAFANSTATGATAMVEFEVQKH